MRSRKSPAIMMTIAYLTIGVALWLQPSRWFNTPSYANLLQLASPAVWGTAYLFVAALLLAAVRWRLTTWVTIIAHTAAISLTAAWLVAFIVRYVTDGGTTVVNVVSWSVFLYALITSAIVLDDITMVDDVKEIQRDA